MKKRIESINVCFLSPSFFPATKYGGPIFSTLYLCRELLRKGLKIVIHTTNVHKGDRLPVRTDQPVKLKELDYHCVHYHKETITERFSLSFFLAIPAAIWNCRIVHSQSIFSFCTPAAIIWSFIFRKKIVISPRGSLGVWCLNQGSKLKLFWLTIFFRPFLSRIYWHVTALQEKNDVLSVFPMIDDDKFIIIPNGIERKARYILSKGELESKFKLFLPEKYVVSSGRIDKKKGYDYTIRALKLLPDDISLVIIGEDYGDKKYLLELAKSLNVNERVHFLGHQGEETKWSIYHHAFALSLNSRQENFGNVYLESMSVGTPIISSIYTPWGFIDKTGAGYCVDNIPELIADKIKLLSLKRDLSVECEKVCANYYWDNIADAFIKEYKRIIDEH